MPSDTLTLALDGEHIALDHYAEAVAGFARLVKALSANADAPEITWEIEALEVSSAITTARAASLNRYGPEHLERVTHDYLRVGHALKSGAVLPFSAEVQTGATEIAHLLTVGIKSLRFETADDDAIVTQPYTGPAKVGPLPMPPTDRGAVTGRVQTISSRSGLRFTLYELLSNRAVSCYVEAGAEDKLVGVWDRIVTVEGVVTRDPETGRPLAVRRISEIHTLEDEGQRGGYMKARAILPRRPGDLRAEDRIRRLRDGG